MDREIEVLRDDIATLKARQKALHSTLATLRSTPTTTSLRESVDTLSAEVRDLLGRLVPLRSGKVSPVSAEEKLAVDRGYDNAEKKSTLRKRIFKNLWGMTCDNLPEGTNKDELWVSASVCSTYTPSSSSFAEFVSPPIPVESFCSDSAPVTSVISRPHIISSPNLLLSGSSNNPRHSLP
jgi:hypothetical protein